MDVDLTNCEGSVVLLEASNNRELRTFIFITIFTGAFGLLVIIFLRKLKKLTHGVEEAEHEIIEDEDQAQIDMH
ncbi:MAG: hypothetical protein U5L96_12805 [Owenweeksia sp.]|nr:hypothetical protein [Owenweeksia sp.]